jgi:GT2 family glycosyltransferase
MDGALDLACRRGFPTPEVSLWRMIGLSKLFPHSPRFGRYNMTFLDPDRVAEVDAVVGACMLLRAAAIEQVGLLDETFFMYGEDLDWAKRIKDAGWKVYYNPQVIVHHVKRAASRHSARAQIEFNRAMRIFYVKHYQVHTPWWMDRLVVAGIGLRDRWERFRQACRRQAGRVA